MTSSSGEVVDRMGEWRCPPCGTMNGPNASACATCGAGRLRGVASQRVNGGPGWRCISCETMNAAMAASCSACGNPQTAATPHGPVGTFESVTVIDRTGTKAVASDPRPSGVLASDAIASAPAVLLPPKNRRAGAIIAAIAATVLLAVVIGVLVNHKQNRSVDAPATPSGSSSMSASPSSGATEPTTTQPVSSPTSPGSLNFLSAGPEPGTAVSLVSLANDQEQATQVVQNLASALAANNWNLARSTYPDLSSSSDASLQNNYSALRNSTVVITRATSQASTQVSLTGAYVAWETIGTTQRTSLYCITWIVDSSENKVLGATNDGGSVGPYNSGWVNPTDPSLLTEVQRSCP